MYPSASLVLGIVLMVLSFLVRSGRWSQGMFDMRIVGYSLAFAGSVLLLAGYSFDLGFSLEQTSGVAFLVYVVSILVCIYLERSKPEQPDNTR